MNLVTFGLGEAPPGFLLTGGLGDFGVEGGAEFSKSATAALIFSAVTSETASFTEAATWTIVFTPAVSTLLSIGVEAELQLVLTPSILLEGEFAKQADLTIIFTHDIGMIRDTVTSASLTVVFNVKARTRVPEVVFNDSYIGRFQVGHDVPLRVVPRNQSGEVALPSAPPVSMVYAMLAAQEHVEDVELPILHRSRTTSMFVQNRMLGSTYDPGNHIAINRWQVGGFQGIEVSMFEVNEGGDREGRVISGHTVPYQEHVLAQMGSGRIMVGARPKVET